MEKLNSNEIHLWYCSDEAIQDALLLQEYKKLLDSKELEQQKRFHFQKHRHQYLITRAMVRTVLSNYVDDVSPANWLFSKNEFGKPAIANPLRHSLKFNLSHTEKMIVMGVSRDAEIGVDVEFLPRIGNMLEIANRFFSPLEIEQLHELPVEKKGERFFDLWTLKEAYIKACGMGLSIPLDEFSYSFLNNKIDISFAPAINDNPDFWQFWQLTPTPEHKVSVAIKSKKVDTHYSINIRQVVPLSKIVAENLQISHGYLSRANPNQVAPVT